MGSCIRRLSSAFTSFSFVCILFRIVCRNTVNRPLLFFFTQICVQQAIFDRRYSERPRPCLARSFRYLHSAHRWSPIGPSLQAFAQLLNSCVQALFKLLCRLTVNTARTPPVHLLPGFREELRCEQMR